MRLIEVFQLAEANSLEIHPDTMRQADRDSTLIKANIREAIYVLAQLRLDWPKMCRALNTFKAARQGLNAGKELVDDFSLRKIRCN